MTAANGPRIEHIYRRLGKDIGWWRSACGMSQADLAKRIGVTRAHVCNIEQGNSRIMTHHLPLIAKALGVDIYFSPRSGRATVVA